MQLLLITEKSLSPNDNRRVGDIVGIFDDDKVFSEQEKSVFQIIKKPDVTKTDGDIQANVETRRVVKTTSLDWEFEDELEKKEVWKNSNGDYNEIVVQPRFQSRYDITSEEIKENYSLYPENTSTTLKTVNQVIEK